MGFFGRIIILGIYLSPLMRQTKFQANTERVWGPFPEHTTREGKKYT
jgi:hypothetical protein